MSLQDPNYVIIKRWVPEWEQTILWEHTRERRRGQQKVMLEVDDHHHHHHRRRSGEYEFVRRKSSRHRSKSPSLLMYLAGGRPR